MYGADFFKVTITAIALVLFSTTVGSAGNNSNSIDRNALIGENLGKGGITRVQQSDGENVMKMVVGGTVRPIGNGLTSGGIEADIDDTKKVSCEKRATNNSKNFKNMGIVGGMHFYCNTEDNFNYYVYACPASLVGEKCDEGSWYLVSGNSNLPAIIKGLSSGSADVIENLSAEVVTCEGNECSVNVKYKRTTLINAQTMDQDGEEYLNRKMKDSKSVEFAVMGNTSAKQRGEPVSKNIVSRYSSCIERNASKFGSGEKLYTCDQTEEVKDPSQCVQVTTCASLRPAPVSKKTCNVQVDYKDVERVEWWFPDDAYGQCTKLNDYKKSCLVSYQYVKRVTRNQVEYVPQTAYGSRCPKIYETDEEGNKKFVGYDSPCTIMVPRYYVSYHDYVDTARPNSCYFYGPGVNFDCGEEVSEQQKWEAISFVMIMGRLPTYDEMQTLNNLWFEVEDEGKTLEEAVMDWKGVRPSLHQAFRNLIGRSPNSSESRALQDALSQWGTRAYSGIKTMNAFNGTRLYYFSKATGCFALDRKLNDIGLAKQMYNYAVRGDLSAVMEAMSQYATR